MKINDLVTTLELSKKLQKSGYKKRSVFGYYKDNFGDMTVLESDITSDWEFICNAYLFEELFEDLPQHLAVDEETYIPIAAFQPGWEKVGKIEIDENPVAILEIYKNSDELDTVMRYSYRGKMIAYNRNSKGQYLNLLSFGDKPSDCSAKMVLLLIQENILDIV